MKIKIGLPLFLFFAYSFLGFALGQEKTIPSNDPGKNLLNIHHSGDATNRPKEWPKNLQLSHENLMNFVTPKDEKFNPLNKPWDLKQRKGNESLIEIESLRNQNSRTYQNPDGTYTNVVVAGPIHYYRNGKWEDIDSKVYKNDNSSYSYKNTSNLMESYFGKNAQNGIKTIYNGKEIKDFLNLQMYWEVNGGKIGIQYPQNVNAQGLENKVYYNGIFNGIDAEFTIGYGRRKLNYILNSKASLGVVPNGAEYLVFSEDIILPGGWNYKISEKEDVYLLDETNNTQLIIPKPFILEGYNVSNISSNDNLESPIFYALKKEGNTLKLIVKIKADWITSESRLFPIAIDPTLYPNSASFWTGFARSNGGGGDNYIRTGYTGNAGISYLTVGYSKFDLTSIPNNSNLLNVTSKFLYETRSGTLNSGQDLAVVDVPLDPVPASYSAIYNSLTHYISNDLFVWNSNPPVNQWYNHTMNYIGMAYVQDAIKDNFVTIGLFPYTPQNYGGNNYAQFYGYLANSNNRPQLEINYSTSCATPTSNSNQYYISNVRFVGTLNPDTNNSTTYSASGYGDYTSLPNRGKQIPGGVVNITVTSNYSLFTKAWVDWNNDGIFDSTEKVFDSNRIVTPSTTFGFVVPNSTAPGTYKVRIRTHNSNWYFRACDNIPNGETEDYSFDVVEDCASKISAVNIDPLHGHRCGAGPVTLSASGNGTSYNWYTSEFGGSPIVGANSSTYTTPSLSSTTTFYVTAVGSCESVKRTPVVAKIDPIPIIDFNATESEICGDTSSMIVTSSGDKEEFTILNEKFDSNLGAFQNIFAGNNAIGAAWTNRPSPFVPSSPTYYVVSPAIASGYDGGNYACSITDVRQNSNIINRLQLINSLNASQLLNLNLDFDLYYSPMSENIDYGYLRVEASNNGGSTWETIHTYVSTQGNPSTWSKQSLSLGSQFLVPNLKIRFEIYALGYTENNTTYWVGNIAGIDNIRVYGDRALDTNFNWSGPSIIYEEDCVTPYTTASTSVCIKPDLSNIESAETWSVLASATLSNGCNATGTIVIQNNTKVWNTGNNNWASNNWKPSIAPPTADQCVYVRTPVTINTGLNGVAKSLVVENTGSLNINAGSSLTITNGIRNEASPSSFVVESDANLIQINPTVNIGAITVKRNATVPSTQYNYWASPVKDQVLYSLYPNLTAGKIMTYNTHDDFFTVVPAGSLSQFGKGYSIKGPSSGGPNITANFVGIPQNESNISGENIIPLLGIGQGYNLIGNPYPSNLDLKLVYEANVNQFYDDEEEDSPSFLFWDNTNNIHLTQQGSNYSGLNYAIYNPSSNMGNYAQDGNQSKKPNGIVKPGQGFLIRAKSTASGLIMNNTMRTTETFRSGVNAPYYKGEFDSNDKFWIDLVGPGGIHTQMSVGYFVEAENSFERFDSPIIMENLSENIYSLSEDNKKLTIQGRKGPFNPDDEIPLVVKTFREGIYQIALNEAFGVFESEQEIYLKDKKAGIFHNLSQNPYRFYSTDNNLIENRFSIVFKQKTKVKFSEIFIGNKVEISSDKGQIYITSSLENIQEVEVYNLFGWRVYKKEAVSSKNFRIQENQLNHKVLVVRVKTESGEIYSEKIIN